MNQEAKTIFSWLHVSDLHFGHGSNSHGWDQEIVLAQLIEDVQAQLPTLAIAPLRAIFVTGDVGFSGDSAQHAGGLSEYEAAQTWLAKLGAAAGVENRRIYVVPGNHDVQRPVASSNRDVRRLLESLRRKDSVETIDDALSNDDDREKLVLRMENFLSFAQGYGPLSSGTPETVVEGGLFWRDTIDVGPHRIAVAGLNTALLSQDDTDHGRLVVGTKQLRALLRPEDSSRTLTVALTHHPLNGGWLRDETAVRNHARAHSTIHLCGHVHDPDADMLLSVTGSQHLSIVAGASHAPASESPFHSYMIAAIMLGEAGAFVRLWPRVWSAKATAFRAYAQLLPDGQNYRDFPLVLPAHSAHADDSSDDDALARELDDAPDSGGAFLDFLVRQEDLKSNLDAAMTNLSSRMHVHKARMDEKVQKLQEAVAAQNPSLMQAAARSFAFDILRMSKDLDAANNAMGRAVTEFESGLRGISDFLSSNPDAGQAWSTQLNQFRGEVAGVRIKADQADAVLAEFTLSVGKLRGVTQPLNTAVRQLTSSIDRTRTLINRMGGLTI